MSPPSLPSTSLVSELTTTDVTSHTGSSTTLSLPLATQQLRWANGAPVAPAPSRVSLSEPIFFQPNPIRGAIRHSDRHQLRMLRNICHRQVQQELRRTSTQIQRDELVAHVNRQLDEMPIFFPWFTYITALAQVIVLIVSMVPQTGSVAPWGYGGSLQYKEFTLFTGETILQEFREPKNLWYGPDVLTLLNYGAKYTPCIRGDDALVGQTLAKANQESTFGCCTSFSGECGMTDFGNCSLTGGVFDLGVLCSEVPSCQDRIVLHPCCFGIKGKCELLKEDHCKFINGMYQKDHELCSQVSCIEKVCQMAGFRRQFAPDQWYRLITPLFMHVGVIHFVMNIFFHLKVVREIEIFSGPLRTGLMFIGSGVGGNILGSIFNPDGVSAGSSGSLYGMMGVMTVDLLQTWRLIPDKNTQLARLLLFLVTILAVGTLPWIDNWAHGGGFFIGIVCGMAFLPYIDLGKVDEQRKFFLQVASIAVLGVLCGGGVILLYKAPDPNFCSWCHYFNCIPYKKGLCDNV